MTLKANNGPCSQGISIKYGASAEALEAALAGPALYMYTAAESLFDHPGIWHEFFTSLGDGDQLGGHYVMVIDEAHTCKTWDKFRPAFHGVGQQAASNVPHKIVRVCLVFSLSFFLAIINDVLSFIT